MRPLVLALIISMLTSMWASAQTVTIPVAKYSGAQLTDADANSILKDGSANLFVPATRAGCGLSLALDGHLSSIPDSLSSIDNTNIDELCALNNVFTVYVVKSISQCGDTMNSIAGCIPQSKKCAAVILQQGSEDNQVLWMHEYGHREGLPHVRDPIGKNLMNCSLVHDNVNLRPAQCDVIKGIQDTVQGIQCPNTVPLDEFLTTHYIHGIPLDEAKQYSNTDQVKMMLDRLHAVPSEAGICTSEKDQNKGESCISRSEYWRNVVMVLGVVGDEESVADLLQFGEKPPCDCFEETFQARLAVPIALGYILKRTHSEAALENLEQHAVAKMSDVSSIAFVRTSILALGASSDPKALDYLRQLRNPKDKRIDHGRLNKLLDYSTNLK